MVPHIVLAATSEGLFGGCVPKLPTLARSDRKRSGQQLTGPAQESTQGIKIPHTLYTLLYSRRFIPTRETVDWNKEVSFSVTRFLYVVLNHTT